MTLNEMQKAVLRDYQYGEFAYFIEEPPEDWSNCFAGDTLLAFMMIELSDTEDCEDINMGILRLNSAKDDIDVALQALEKLQEAIAAKIGEQL